MLPAGDSDKNECSKRCFQSYKGTRASLLCVTLFSKKTDISTPFFYTRFLTQGWKLPPDATASSRLSWYWRSSPDHKFNSKELPLLEKPPQCSEISSDRCSEQKSSLLAIAAPWIRSAVTLEESELCLVMCNRFTEEFRIPSFQESSSATNGCVCSRMSSAWTIASLKIMRTVLPRKRSHGQYLPSCFSSCFHVLITSETWILN